MEGKVALITGGTAGIGLAVAKAFVEAGCETVISGRRDATESAAAIGATAMIVNVTAKGDLERAIRDIKLRYGGLDILVLNAGIANEYTIANSTDTEYQRDFDVNVRGVLNGLRQGVKGLNRGGNIIVTSSINASISIEASSVYAASKAAVNSLVRSAAIEFAEYDIRVNSVSPGPTKTDMALPDSFAEKLAPRKRQADAAEMVGAYLLLASDAGCNINGADIVVDGGLSAGFAAQVTNWVTAPD